MVSERRDVADEQCRCGCLAKEHERGLYQYDPSQFGPCLVCPCMEYLNEKEFKDDMGIDNLHYEGINIDYKESLWQSLDAMYLRIRELPEDAERDKLEASLVPAAQAIRAYYLRLDNLR